jgi:hypothetical protein
LYDENDRTFAVMQEYSPLADMTSQAAITVIGRLNINTTIPGVSAPQVRSVLVEPTGGSILGSGNLWISLCVYSADGYSPQSNVVQVAIDPATDTNKVTLGSLKWPTGSFTGYAVFAGTDPQLMCWQATVAGALPSTVVFSGPVKRSTWGPPRWDARNVRIKAKRVLHGGVLGTPINAISGSDITCNELAGLGDDWTGRTLTVLADATDGSAAVWNFEVTAYDDLTGTFTVSGSGPDPATVGVEVDDVVAVMLEAEAATDYTIQDTGIVNGLYPSGMITDSEAGYLIRIIAGKGRGQLRRIETNTSDTWMIDEPWEVVPDISSKFIVEVPTWEYFAESTRAEVRQPDINTTLRLIADNMIRQTILVTGIVVDVDGNESPERLSPMRMIYMFGEPSVTGDWDQHTIILEDPLTVGDDKSNNRYQLLLDATDMVMLKAARMTALVAPSGGPCTGRIMRSTDLITWEQVYEISIADGDNSSAILTVFDIDQLDKNDYLRADITAANGGLGIHITTIGQEQ